jgi:glycine cleavage system aminomethyltransferase T
MAVMVAMLHRHGATMVERHGRLVAAHFGSAATEAAVCRGGVGLAERSDRATLDVRGPRADVAAAIAAVARLGGHRAWWTQLAPGRAIVRCEGDAEDACASAMRAAEGVEIIDLGGDYAAVDLIGPLAGDVLRAAAVDERTDPVIVLHQGEGYVELLVARSYGPALWNRLLEAGAPFGIACVGIDAIEHLAVSDHLSEQRRSGARVVAAPAE